MESHLKFYMQDFPFPYQAQDHLQVRRNLL